MKGSQSVDGKLSPHLKDFEQCQELFLSLHLNYFSLNNFFFFSRKCAVDVHEKKEKEEKSIRLY